MMSKWDATPMVVNGFTNLSIEVRHMGGPVFHVGVPADSTPRQMAEIVHGFEGNSVVGFGYGPMDEHPGNCVVCCAADEPELHDYIKPEV